MESGGDAAMDAGGAPAVVDRKQLPAQIIRTLKDRALLAQPGVAERAILDTASFLPEGGRASRWARETIGTLLRARDEGAGVAPGVEAMLAKLGVEHSAPTLDSAAVAAAADVASALLNMVAAQASSAWRTEQARQLRERLSMELPPAEASLLFSPSGASAASAASAARSAPDCSVQHPIGASARVHS